MNVHKNARTTSHGRLLLVQRVRQQGWRVAEAASAAGVSERTAYKWLARYRAGGEPALQDRGSTPARSPRRTAAAIVIMIGQLRRERLLRSPMAHPSVMLRIDAVLAVGNYRAQYRAAEDLDLFLRLMARYECANLPETGLYYELNEGGISATKRRRQIVSTLRLQARYLNVLNWRDWAGLAKSLLHFVTPYRMLQRIKRTVFAPRTR